MGVYIGQHSYLLLARLLHHTRIHTSPSTLLMHITTQLGSHQIWSQRLNKSQYISGLSTLLHHHIRDRHAATRSQKDNKSTPCFGAMYHTHQTTLLIFQYKLLEIFYTN